MMLANLGGLYSAGKSELQSLISSLFGQGQQGLLFVPEPGLEGKDVLYQDAAGTTLTDANGDPVGLGLEFSQELELGPELVTNGAGTDTTGWDLGSGLSSLTTENGEFKATANGGINAHFSRLVSIEVGKSYKVSVSLRSPSSNSITNLGQMRVSGGDLAEVNVQIGVEDETTVLTGILTATGTATRFYVRLSTKSDWGGDGDVVYADNISVKELSGNHLTQPTSADRPTYNTDGTLHWLAHDGAGDNLKSTYASPVAQPCTLSVAIDKQDAGSDKVIVTGLGSADRHQLSINASGNLVGIAGGTTLDSGSGLANGKHIVTAVLDGVSSSIRVDGVEVAAGDLGSASSGGLTLSSLWDGTLSITQDVYGSIHAEGVDDVAKIESYLADRAGITL